MTPPTAPWRHALIDSAPSRPAFKGPTRTGLSLPVLLAVGCVALMALPGSLGSHGGPAAAPAPGHALLTAATGAAQLVAAQRSLALHQGPAVLPRSANASGPSNWSQDLPASGAPSARELFTMAYDPTDGYVVLFGGGDLSNGTLFNDTWTFRAGNWTQLFPSVSPPARRSAVMTWDAADGYLVLFGGLYLQDTWSFLGGGWTDRTATNVTSLNTPSIRWNAQMAYDPATASVILFGGCNALSCASSTNDTWSYRGGAWTPLFTANASAPSDRGTSSLVYYPTDRALLLFGGSTPNQTVLGDTWELTSTGWVPVHPFAGAPPARGDQWMVYDSATGYLLMFGGLEYSGGSSYAVGDTWSYTNTFMGEIWTNETANNSLAPPSLWGEQSAGTWDAADHCAILFGGSTTSGADLGGTWGYGCSFPATGGTGGNGSGGTGGTGTGNGTGNWTEVNAGTGGSSPSGREFFSMAYDPVDQYVVLFGGGDATGPGLQYNDTWTFSNGSWTPLNIPSPAPRRSAAMTWDAADGYLLLFGGVYPGATTQFSTQYQDSWSFVHGAWTNRTAAVPNATNTPSARWMAQMAYDPATGSVILFGGCVALACAASLDDTWAYAAGAWTNITAAVGSAPPVRGTASLLWYPPDNALFLFGGSNPNQTVRGDSWELGASGWTQLNPSLAPSSRGDTWMVYDNTTGDLVLFGGARYSVSPTLYTLGDTWIYLPNGTWVNETAHNPVAPPSLEGAGPVGAWDAHDGYAVLFGGYSSSFTPLSATWVYNGTGSGNGTSGTGGSNGSGGSRGTGGNPNGSSGGNPNGSSGGPPGDTGTPGQAPPKILGQFQESTASGHAPLLVAFTATATGGVAPYTYAWNFGDGSTAGTGASVSHTYTSAGRFIPVVTITDAKGARVSAVLPDVVVAGSLASVGPLLPALSANLVVGSLLAATLALVGAGLILHRRRAERLRQEGELFLGPALER